MMDDLAPKLKSFLRWNVAIADEGGSRVVLTPPKPLGHEGVLVDLDNGIMHQPLLDVRSLVSKGVWTDQDLPGIDEVLGKVQSSP